MSNDALLAKALAYTPSGKTILVTGGTKGIGRAIVEELGALQCHVYTCSRSAEDLNELLSFCKEKGWDVAGTVADVALADDRAKLVEGFTQHFGRSLDVLVNNVGTNVRLPTVEYSESDYQKVFNTNLESAFFLSTLCYDLLKASEKGGVVVMNSSVAGGPTALKSGVLYGMTKAAMNHMVKYLGCEWAEHNIRVVGVAPWYTATPLALQVLQNEEYLKKVLDRTPMKRVAQPEEVARTVAFVSSPAASYITAAILPVDGGYSAMGGLF